MGLQRRHQRRAGLVYVNKITAARAAAEGPRRRPADSDTRFYYATPTLSLAHRYISHTGNSEFPLDAWVTVARVQHGRGHADHPGQGLLDDQHQGRDAGLARDARELRQRRGHRDRARRSCSRCRRTNWTPTGAGPVEFTIAQPGKLGIVQIESKGYDRVGYNTPLNVRPFGSVFVRAQTESYGASNDCIPGAISRRQHRDRRRPADAVLR